MKKVVKPILTLFIAPLFMGCSDHDNISDEEAQAARLAAISDSLTTVGLMQSLCTIDTLSDGTLSYTPRLGEAIESATPTVYYTIAYDIEDAWLNFQRIISPLNVNGEYGLEQDEVRQGNIHLKYTESKMPAELARITVDCPELKDVLTEIVFITEERWPKNDMSTPFKLASVWRYQNRNYVCVRDSRCNQGIMLSFDGPHEEEKFEKYDYWQGKFTLYTGMASSEAIQQVWHLLHYSNSLYASMLASGVNLHWLWNSLYDGVWQRFDHGYTYSHYLNLFWYSWDVHLNKSSICGDGKGDYIYWEENMRFRESSTPFKNSASHEIRFYSDFNTTGWTCIYKGT